MTSKETEPGKAVDSDGKPVVDPSRNVLDLVDAAVERLDDLRVADQRRTDDLRIADSRRLDELRVLTAAHNADMTLVHNSYREKLADAEAKRIDAIRAVDVNAVAVASERASAQATVLANQVAASAETQRALVAQTAATIAQQFSQTTGQLIDRIALLEKSQYESKGKEVVTSPAQDAKFDALARSLETTAREIASLRETRSSTEGKGIGMGMVATLIASGIVALAGLAAIITLILRVAQ